MLEKYIHIFSDSAEDMVKEIDGVKEVNITSYVNSCVLSILHSKYYFGDNEVTKFIFSL